MPRHTVDGEARLRAASERLMLTQLFGERLRALRVAAGLSQAQLARRCRVSSTMISKAELGHAGEPGLVLILIVCLGLRVTPDALIGALPAPKEPRPR